MKQLFDKRASSYDILVRFITVSGFQSNKTKEFMMMLKNPKYEINMLSIWILFFSLGILDL